MIQHNLSLQKMIPSIYPKLWCQHPPVTQAERRLIDVLWLWKVIAKYIPNIHFSSWEDWKTGKRDGACLFPAASRLFFSQRLVCEVGMPWANVPSSSILISIRPTVTGAGSLQLAKGNDDGRPTGEAADHLCQCIIYIYICVCVCTPVYVYVYKFVIYAYYIIYMYMYTCIYTHISPSLSLTLSPAPLKSYPLSPW